MDMDPDPDEDYMEYMIIDNGIERHSRMVF